MIFLEIQQHLWFEAKPLDTEFLLDLQQKRSKETDAYQDD